MAQVQYADLVIVNKVDLAGSEDDLRLLTETVQSLNPSAQIVQTTYCNVDLSLVVPASGEEPNLSEAPLRAIDSSRLQERASHDRSVTRLIFHFELIISLLRAYPFYLLPTHPYTLPSPASFPHQHLSHRTASTSAPAARSLATGLRRRTFQRHFPHKRGPAAGRPGDHNRCTRRAWRRQLNSRAAVGTARAHKPPRLNRPRSPSPHHCAGVPSGHARQLGRIALCPLILLGQSVYPPLSLLVITGRPTLPPIQRLDSMLAYLHVKQTWTGLTSAQLYLHAFVEATQAF